MHISLVHPYMKNCNKYYISVLKTEGSGQGGFTAAAVRDGNEKGAADKRENRQPGAEPTDWRRENYKLETTLNPKFQMDNANMAGVRGQRR